MPVRTNRHQNLHVGAHYTDRSLRKCSTPFIKESGCNKMTCTKCQAITCYVCNKIITGYEHFNDPNRGGKSGNCPLFDNHEARHEEEARAAARAVKEQIRTENPDITDKDLEIQLSEAVKKQEEDRRRRAAVGAGAVHPLVIPPYNPALLAGARCHRRHLGIPPPPPRLPMNQLGFEAPGNPPPYQARRELVGNGGPVPAAQVYQPNRYYIPNPGAPPVQIGIPQPVHPQRTRRAAAAAAQPMNAVGAAPQAYQPVQARHARPQPQQQPRNNVGQFQPHAQQYNPGNYGPQTVPPVGRDRRAQAYVPQAQQAQNGRRGVGGR